MAENLKQTSLHTNILLRDIAQLLDGKYSDVSIQIENVTFRVHKSILAARSEYFAAMFFGAFEDGKSDCVVIKDVGHQVFRDLLTYIYTGSSAHFTEKDSSLIDMLIIADRFGFPELQRTLTDLLESRLSSANVLDVLETSLLLSDSSPLTEKCLFKIDTLSEEILNSKKLLDAQEKVLVKLLVRDSFYAKEIDVVKFIKNWHLRRGLSEPSQNMLDCARLHLLNDDELLNWLRSLKLFDDTRILNAIAIRFRGNSGECSLEPSNVRGKIVPDVNLMETEFSGFGSHENDEIKFTCPCYINYIEISPDKSIRDFSFRIETSNDGIRWLKLVDYSHYKCRNRQRIWTRPLATKYIRYFFVNELGNKEISMLFRFSIKYSTSTRDYQLENDLLVPKSNVARKGYANVLSGVSREPNSLIDGNFDNYDWNVGYTCHQLGNGDITVRFNQPYVIGSIRMLLWDLEPRSYSYYIQTSLDGENWTMVVDRRNDLCSSWQYMEFSQHPVVFIKIIGTRNTANEVFHLVHFECPAVQAQ